MSPANSIKQVRTAVSGITTAGVLSVVLVLLTGISLTMSGFGLAGLVSGFGAKAALFLVAACLSVIGVCATREFLARQRGGVIDFFRRAATKSIYLIIILACFGFSTATNFGFFFNLIAADDLAGEVSTDEAERLAERATIFSDRYANAARRAEELASYSARVAQEEFANGGTCGDGSNSGPGPRRNRRLADQAESDGWSGHFSDRAEQAEAIALRISAAAAEFDPQTFEETEAAMAGAWNELQALASDPEIARARSTAAERIRIGNEGWTVGERLFTCPDPELEAKLRAFESALEFPALGHAPALFEPSELNAWLGAYRAVLRMAFSGLSLGGHDDLAPAEGQARADHLAGRGVEEDAVDAAPDPMGEVFDQASILLLPAFLIDFVIMLTAFLIEGQRRIHGKEQYWPSAPLRHLTGRLAATPLRQMARARLSAGGQLRSWAEILTILDEFISLDGGAVWAFVPASGRSTKPVMSIIRLLEAMGAARRDISVRREQLDHFDRIAVSGRSTGPVLAYRIDRDTYRDLYVLAMREAANNERPLERAEEDERGISIESGE